MYPIFIWSLRVGTYSWLHATGCQCYFLFLLLNVNIVCTHYTQPSWPTHNHAFMLGCMPPFSSKWPPWREAQTVHYVQISLTQPMLGCMPPFSSKWPLWREAQTVHYVQISLTQPMSELKVHFGLGLHLWNVLLWSHLSDLLTERVVHRTSFVCVCMVVCIVISVSLCSFGLGCVHGVTYIVFAKNWGPLFLYSLHFLLSACWSHIFSYQTITIQDKSFLNENISQKLKSKQNQWNTITLFLLIIMIMLSW